MKFFLFICSYVLITEISAFTFNRIQDIEGTPEVVDFDSDGNIYVGVDLTSRHQLYKLNSSKNFLWAIAFPDFTDFISQFFVTNDRTIYFDLANFKDSNSVVAILKENSTNVEAVDTFPYGFYFKDNNDNLFYNGAEGVHVIRPKSTVPVLIKNLEYDFIVNNRMIIPDKLGNVYIGVGNYLAFITRESLQEDFPSATLTKVAEDSTTVVADLVVDEKNDLWILLTDVQAYHEGTVKKLSNGVLETINIDKNHQYSHLLLAKDKIFVTEGKTNNGGSIYYITLENEVVEIPELSNTTLDVYSTQGIIDSEGYAYFKTYPSFSPSLGQMILLRPNEIKPTPIELGSASLFLSSIKLDFDEDVWIVATNDLYYLKKGETVAEKVNLVDVSCQIGPPVFDYNIVNINWITKEVYVSCLDGMISIVKS